MQIRVADYIASRLADAGLKHVFMVTGGGAMHLNDAFGRERRLVVVPVHHEQAASMAAESYARFSGEPAVVNVTTGPGGVNALNGVFGAYTDSVPMIVVSGQVKRETMIGSYDLPLRQLGDQEVDIVRMAAVVTKKASVLWEPGDVRRVIEEAIALSTEGRPGPVWIDVPGDVQGALVEADALAPYEPPSHKEAPSGLLARLTEQQAREAAKALLERLARARRPVVLGGGGVRASRTFNLFNEWIGQVGIPVVTAWNAHDLLPDDHPLYAGRPGTVGDRAGNFAVQNADLLIVLGSRLNVRQISYNWAAFARFADIVMIDVDPAELAKPTLKLAEPICADLKVMLPALIEAGAGRAPTPAHAEYLAWCKERVAKYPVVLETYAEVRSPINPYCFVDRLFENLDPGETIVTADGTACVTTFQAAKLKADQRLYTNSGSASMGFDLPAAIGAVLAGGDRRTGRVVCLAGDGSIMMNLQELATIAGRRMPIKIFLLNNDGYHSIRQSQQAYFPDNVVGCGPDSELPFPDFQAVATAFGIPARRSTSLDDLDAAIRETLGSDGPQFCEVVLDKRQAFAPKTSSRRLPDGRMESAPLEDLAPFLPRDELSDNMLVREPSSKV